MEKWQTGDMAAFEAFFRDYERTVFKNAYLITGTREDAEDVLQDVFVSVWKSRHTFDSQKGKPATWLHRITVNECLRKRRKGQPAMLCVNTEDFDRAGSRVAADAGSPHLDRLGEEMAALDARHRTVLVLRYFNDLSYQEIAGVLGVPLGTVKSRINHALKTLRARIKDSGGVRPGQDGAGKGIQ